MGSGNDKPSNGLMCADFQLWEVSFVAVPSSFATGERKDTNIYVASVLGSLS